MQGGSMGLPRTLAASLVAVATLSLPAAHLTARAHPDRPGRRQPQDLGPTAPAQTVSASVVLKVRHAEQLEALVADTQDPHSPRYHEFVSLHEFVDRFAPDASDIAAI